MFRNAYRLPFKLLGIPVQLDVSFLVILPIFAWIIGSNLEGYIDTFGLDISPDSLQEGSKPFLIGLAAALGLFASVLVHELGHSLVGRHYHLEIKSITLWLLGGMAQFKEMPRRGGVEAIVAIAGPITSYLVGGACWLLFLLVPTSFPATYFLLAYLMWMNVILATFNLLPALPLDGGRVLRSLLALRGNHLQATLTAASISKALAFMLGILGFISVNVFLILVAFFVYMAGAAELQMATTADVLRGVKVRDIMTRTVKSIPPETTLSGLLDTMLEDGHVAYPVVDAEGKVLGLITLRDLQSKAPLQEADGALTVRSIMPAKIHALDPDENALDAFQKMTENSSGRLLVLDSGGRLSGIMSKTDLVRAVQVRLVGQLMHHSPEA